MKILSPVDFSNCSGNALTYAAGIAKETDAKLFLHHVHTDEDEPMDTEKALELKKSLGIFYRHYTPEHSNIEFSLQESTDVTALALLPQLKEFEFVIMGTKGAGALKSTLAGSNTVRVMDAITNPLIIVPEGAKPLQKSKPMLLMTDYNPTENLHVFDPLIKLLQLFNAELVILNVRKTEKKYEIYHTVEKSRLENWFDGKIKYRIETVFHGDVEDGVNSYMRGNSFQLICMVYHPHSLLDNLFGRNHTHEMAFHATIPLLVLNKKNV